MKMKHNFIQKTFKKAGRLLVGFHDCKFSTNNVPPYCLLPGKTTPTTPQDIPLDKDILKEKVRCQNSQAALS